MAGSYRHITRPDGSLDESMDLIENLRDAHEALEEMWLMIDHLTGGDKKRIHEAYVEGYFKRRCPPENLPLASYDRFWRE